MSNHALDDLAIVLNEILEEYKGELWADVPMVLRKELVGLECVLRRRLRDSCADERNKIYTDLQHDFQKYPQYNMYNPTCTRKRERKIPRGNWNYDLVSRKRETRSYLKKNITKNTTKNTTPNERLSVESRIARLKIAIAEVKR